MKKSYFNNNVCNWFWISFNFDFFGLSICHAKNKNDLVMPIVETQSTNKDNNVEK